MARITVDRLHKSFGATDVLRGVSLEIADREFMTLVGPSGCGKSTLLRIIAGLEEQSGGQVLIDDRVVDQLRPRDRDLAMVFQSYALYPHLSVAENIAVPLRMRWLNGWQRLPLVGALLPTTRRDVRAIGEAVRKTAAALDIGHLLDRKPGQLSGGQRQRVALGRAMVRAPQAFLMDEPLSNLDAKLRVSMRAEIAQLHRQLGATFVYVTHDQAEAMTMSDRIAVMMDGDILQVDRPEVVYQRPAEIRVARFIGSPSINLLPGTIRGDRGIELLGQATGLSTEAAAGACQIGIRPERLALVPAGAPAMLSGRLLHSEYLGSEVFLHVGVADQDAPLIVRSEAQNGASVHLDEDVGLGFAPEDAVVFDGRGMALAAFAEQPLERAHG